MVSTRWLCISTRANDEVTRKMNLWGVAKRYASIIARVKMGDTLFMYTMKEIGEKEIIPSVITGVYEAISEVYEDESPIFVTPKALGDEVFPYRIKLKQIRVFAEPIPFKPLVPEMSFIENKAKWSAYIRTAMRVIPEVDYQRIVKEGK